MTVVWPLWVSGRCLRSSYSFRRGWYSLRETMRCCAIAGKTLQPWDSTSCRAMTVLSRCVRVDIAPIAPDVLAEALSKHYPGREVYSAAALSGGYAGRAETILSDENYEKDFALAFDTLRFMKTARDILPFSRRWMERKNTLPDVLDWLAVILSDCMSAAEGAVTRIRLKSEIQDIKQL